MHKLPDGTWLNPTIVTCVRLGDANLDARPRVIVDTTQMPGHVIVWFDAWPEAEAWREEFGAICATQPVEPRP